MMSVCTPSRNSDIGRPLLLLGNSRHLSTQTRFKRWRMEMLTIRYHQVDHVVTVFDLRQMPLGFACTCATIQIHVILRKTHVTTRTNFLKILKWVVFVLVCSIATSRSIVQIGHICKVGFVVNAIRSRVATSTIVVIALSVD